MFDPPFFYITLEQMATAIKMIVAGSTNDCKLLMSFMIKDESRVRAAFNQFGLERTSFELEYATVKPNRWENYGLYSNVDLPMIKRIKKNKK